MALFKGKANQSTTRNVVKEGSEQFLRLMRDGTLYVADWRQASVNAGFGYMANVGAFSTPILGGGAGTVLDIDEPELTISIPSGTTLFPLRIHVSAQVPLIAADSDETEILIAVDQDKAQDATGTATAETVYPMNTLVAKTSACTVRSAYTATCTDPVLDLELAHAVAVGDVQGIATNANWGMLDLLYEPVTSPPINGPAMIVVYWGGTVGTSGFAVASWIEFPTTDFAL